MSKKDIGAAIAVTLAVAVVAVFLYSGLIPGPNKLTTNLSDAQNASATDAVNQIPDNQVLIQDTVVGTGAEAKTGDTLKVNYIGKLQDGTTFDASANHGGVFEFKLGAGQVIPGWEQGIQGMKVGGTRIIVIPPALGYGAQEVGPIPANSVLIFQVELVDVVEPGAAQ